MADERDEAAGSGDEAADSSDAPADPGDEAAEPIDGMDGGEGPPADADVVAGGGTGDDEEGSGGLSERAAVLISAIVGVVVASLAVWWASGFAVFYETLFRVQPTLEGGGVGTDWVTGNTVPAFDFAIALVHAVDVLMGLFILLILFVHWGAFRRLATRMQPPEDAGGEGVAADGGRAPKGGDGE